MTIGLFLAINALAGWIYGTDGRVFPRIFANESLVSFGDVTDHPGDGRDPRHPARGRSGLLYLLFQHTKVGLAMRAVASNPESAALVGIPVGPHPHARAGAWPPPSAPWPAPWPPRSST